MYFSTLAGVIPSVDTGASNPSFAVVNSCFACAVAAGFNPFAAAVNLSFAAFTFVISAWISCSVAFWLSNTFCAAADAACASCFAALYSATDAGVLPVVSTTLLTSVSNPFLAVVKPELSDCGFNSALAASNLACASSTFVFAAATSSAVALSPFPNTLSASVLAASTSC